MSAVERALVPLQGLTPEELVRLLPGVELAEARRIVSTVHRDGDVSEPNSAVYHLPRK